MAATVQIPAEFKAVDKFSHVVKRMTMGVGNFSKSGITYMQRMNQKFNRTFKSMSRLSQLAVGLSAGAIFSAGIQNNLAYNESLMSMSSITGAVGNDLAILEGHAMKVAKATKMMGKDVLIGMEDIASAKPELLKTPKALAEITKNAIILSKASRLDLATSAESLTTSLNQFNLGADKSLMAINALAAGSVYGASKIPQTSEALSKFGTIAAATGTKLNESIALIQLASPFEKGAEAGTKLRNILGKIAGAKILPADQQKILKNMGVDIDKVTNSALPLNSRLLEMSKIAGNTNAVMKVFGTENAALAQAVLNNADGFQTMLDNVNKVGMAEAQAAKNASSFAERINAIKNSFLNTTTATNSNNEALAKIGTSMDWIAANMDKVIITAGAFAGVIATMKLFVLITNIATAAQTLFAGATLAATWPILAIIAAVTAVVAIFYYWDDITKWFLKQWKTFTSWISNLWDGVVKWFQDFDFKAFFKSIGESILKFMLWPMKQLLSLASNLPGKIGKMATVALDKVKELTGDTGVTINQENPLDGPEQHQLQSDQALKQSMMSGSLDINLSDPGKLVKSTNDRTEGIPLVINKTQGAF